MPRRARFTVSFDFPEGADYEDAYDYVEAALRTYRGSLMPPWVDDGPGDVMWDLDPDTLVIRYRNQK